MNQKVSIELPLENDRMWEEISKIKQQITDYDRYIQAQGPHSKHGKFYHRKSVELKRLVFNKLLRGSILKSTVKILEIAAAIETKNIDYIGDCIKYQEVRDLYIKNKNRATPAYCALLIIIMHKIGRFNEFHKEFPEVYQEAQMIVKHMKQYMHDHKVYYPFVDIVGNALNSCDK